MSVPFTTEELYAALLPWQRARLHISAMHRQGKRPSVSVVAHVAGVSRATAKRQLRTMRRKKGYSSDPPKTPEPLAQVASIG